MAADRNFENLLEWLSGFRTLKADSGRGCTGGRSRPFQELSGLLYGFGSCAASVLSAPELKIAEETRNLGNLTTCLDDVGQCDQTALAPWEKQAVAEAKRGYNFENC